MERVRPTVQMRILQKTMIDDDDDDDERCLTCLSFVDNDKSIHDLMVRILTKAKKGLTLVIMQTLIL